MPENIVNGVVDAAEVITNVATEVPMVTPRLTKTDAIVIGLTAAAVLAGGYIVYKNVQKKRLKVIEPVNVVGVTPVAKTVETHEEVTTD